MERLNLVTHCLQRQGFVSGVALEYLPPVTVARLLIKDKYLELMFGDVGQAPNQSLDVQNC